MTSQRWTLTLQDQDDPHGFSARARQLTASRWDVEYYRGDDVVSTGGISTPPPHEPPFVTLADTLRELRKEVDWADRIAGLPDGSLEIKFANEVLADSPRFPQEYEGQWTPADGPDEEERP